MSEGPLELLALAVSACEEAGAAYAVIGAVARNAWAPPRATTDLDLAIAVDAPGYASLIEALERRGIKVVRTVSSAAEAAVPDIVLLRRETGLLRRLDLLIAKTPFELEAVEQAVSLDVGRTCRIVRPEHLIVYKLIAGRPRDLSDAGEVMRTRDLAGAPVDLDLVGRWAREWSVEDRLAELRKMALP